jgi:hypothetical protein
MATRQSIPTPVERAQGKRGDASVKRVQRAAVPASSGGRIDPRGLTPQSILHLQRTAGNTAVNALLSGTMVQRREDAMVQRHTHHIPPKKEGTNVWNTSEESE